MDTWRHMKAVKENTFYAVGVDETGMVWHGHFGSSPQFFIFDQSGYLTFVRKNPFNIQGHVKEDHNHPKAVMNLLSESHVFIGYQFGSKSKRSILEKAGIKLATTEEKMAQCAIASYLIKHIYKAPAH